MPRRRARTRGQRVCAFIEEHCIVPEGMLVRQRMKLAPFQRRFILAIYDNPHGTRRAYLSIAKKNGKTGLVAGLALAHLVGPEAQLNTEIVSGARSRKQAAQVYRYASKMADMSPTLRDVVKPIPSQKILIGLPRNVEYQAIAAEASTAHGGSPVLAILDELGQVLGPKDAFVDAIKSSQGAHASPLLVAISTQAPNDADMFSIWLDDAAKSKAPRIISHVYQAPEGCDVLDEEAWVAANPALGIFRSREDLREQAEDAHRMPSAENSFRNLCLNQRVSTTSPFISQAVWKSCGAKPAPAPSPDVPVWAGLDLSSRKDLTALEIIQQHDGTWHVWSYFWTPEKGLAERSRRDRTPYEEWVREGYLRTTPGATVDFEYVAQEIAELLEGLDVVAVGYDRWRIELLIKEFERIDVELPLIPFGQGFKDMPPAIDALEADLLNGRIAHGMHPVLTMCAANAVTLKNPAGERKLDKSKATGRIDGMVALTIARGSVDMQQPDEPSVYETRGVLEYES
ncbi:MAG: terminase large subunit [Actinomycetota bacterium]|nr:terminase large subunit [Actinomycetota bacterium]